MNAVRTGIRQSCASHQRELPFVTGRGGSAAFRIHLDRDFRLELFVVGPGQFVRTDIQPGTRRYLARSASRDYPRHRSFSIPLLSLRINVHWRARANSSEQCAHSCNSVGLSFSINNSRERSPAKPSRSHDPVRAESMKRRIGIREGIHTSRETVQNPTYRVLHRFRIPSPSFFFFFFFFFLFFINGSMLHASSRRTRVGRRGIQASSNVTPLAELNLRATAFAARRLFLEMPLT